MLPIQSDTPSSLLETLEVFRRHKLAMLLCIVILTSGLVAWGQYRNESAPIRYRATHTLAPNPARGGAGAFLLPQMTVLINDGAARDAARELLGDDLRGISVRASSDDKSYTLSITAEGPDPARTVEAADVYAAALQSELLSQDEEVRSSQVGVQQQRVAAARENLDGIEATLFNDPDNSALQAERDSAQNTYISEAATLSSLEQQPEPAPVLSTLNDARAGVIASGGFAGLGLVQQGLVSLVMSAVLALGLAYLLEALDRRLRTAAAATAAFGVPVLSEVPHGGKAFSSGPQLAPQGSVITEAYRRLRTVVQLEHEAADQRRCTTVMVVSPSAGEGKTTTVAHLARALGEVDANVLIVSSDFRRPRLHLYFGLEADSGLLGLVDAEGQAIPADLVRKTSHKGVSVVTAGGGSDEPTRLIHVARRLVEAAKQHYDYVILDTSPLLATNDALDFIREIDIVIATARFRRTTRTAAERTADILNQINAPLLGVVLTGVRDGEGYGYYYGEYTPTVAAAEDLQPPASILRATKRA